MLIANLALLRLAAALRAFRARLPVTGGEAHHHAGVVGHTETISYAFEDVERSNGSTTIHYLRKTTLGNAGNGRKVVLAGSGVLLDEAQYGADIASTQRRTCWRAVPNVVGDPDRLEVLRHRHPPEALSHREITGACVQAVLAGAPRSVESSRRASLMSCCAVPRCQVRGGHGMPTAGAGAALRMGSRPRQPLPA